LASWDPALHGNKAQRTILALLILVMWAGLVYRISVFHLFGPRVLPILRAVLDTMPFFVILMLAMLGFTHSYYALRILRDNQADPADAHLFAYFRPVWALALIGEIHTETIEGYLGHHDDRSETPLETAQFLFFGTTLVVSVLLMSILIGILGSNYDRYVVQSQPMFSQHRAREIDFLSHLPFFGRHIWSQSEGFLWFAVKEKPDREQAHLVTHAALRDIQLQQKRQAASLSSIGLNQEVILQQLSKLSTQARGEQPAQTAQELRKKAMVTAAAAPLEPSEPTSLSQIPVAIEPDSAPEPLVPEELVPVRVRRATRSQEREPDPVDSEEPRRQRNTTRYDATSWGPQTRSL
jgi:hypothetical protein